MSSARDAPAIGLVLFDVRNPFFTELAAAVEERAAIEGMDVFIADSGGDVEREALEAERLVARGVRGLIVAPRDAAAPHLRQSGIPVVFAGARSTAVPSVVVDGMRGGRLAAEHLLARGRRRLMFVGGPVDVREFADRLAGARAAVREVGRARLHVRATTEATVAQGIAAGRAIAALGRRPDAVLAANDLLAAGVLRAVAAEGLRVPEDLSITGYDDLEVAATAPVPLTSVRQPRRTMGAIAAELLLAALRGEPVPPPVVLLPELVVRASTA